MCGVLSTVLPEYIHDVAVGFAPELVSDEREREKERGDREHTGSCSAFCYLVVESHAITSVLC